MTFVNRPLSLRLTISSCWIQGVLLLSGAAAAFSQTVSEYDADPLTPYEFLRLHRLHHAQRIALQSDTHEVNAVNLAQLAFEEDWQGLQDNGPHNAVFSALRASSFFCC